MNAVRPALRTYLSELDSARFRVAVMGFNARAVESSIRAARFVTPAQAAAALSGLAAPSGNTALYSATVLAAQHVTDFAIRAQARPVLLSITDGRNDVQSGDDSNLLVGPSGLRAAATALEELGLDLVVVGVGNGTSPDELRNLAGADRVLTAMMDPLDLTRDLRSRMSSLTNRKSLVFPISEHIWRSIAARPAAVDIFDGNGVLQTRETVRGPLLLLPATSESLEGASAVGRPRWARRTLLAFAIMSLFALAAVLLRHSLEISPGMSGRAVAPRSLRGVSHTGLRPGVREVAARRADVETGEPALRVVQLGRKHE